MTYKLYAYNQASESAKALAHALGIKRVRHQGKLFKKKQQIINWGASHIKRGADNHVVINSPKVVALAVNKLLSFHALREAALRGIAVPIPLFTENKAVANEWRDSFGMRIVERHALTGHSGQGIVINKAGEALGDAPLYVQYIPKKQELRLHVFREEVFKVQQKKRKLDVPDEDVNWQVRNHANGFVYVNLLDEEVPKRVKSIAIAAVRALGLDFGAVDMIYNEKLDGYFVLEINTACGLEGSTVDAYADVFRRHLGIPIAL